MATDAPGPGLYLRELCEWKAESYSQLVGSQTKKGNLYRTWFSVFFFKDRNMDDDDDDESVII